MSLVAEMLWRKQGGVTESFGITIVQFLVCEKLSKFPVFVYLENFQVMQVYH